MSAFLAPIHFWLYHKIIMQERLTKALADGARREGWQVVASGELINECVNTDETPLENIIDQGNIHAWLQARIIDAESRYARLVKEILNESSARLVILENLAYEFGRENQLKPCNNATEAFRALDEILLDGMPCDRVNQPLEQDEKRYRWKRTADIHGMRWTEIGADGTTYYILRAAFVKGIFENSTFDFIDYQDGSYEIIKA